MTPDIFNTITLVIDRSSYQFGRLVRILGVAPGGQPPILYSDYDLRRAGGVTDSCLIEIQELTPQGLPSAGGIGHVKPSELLLFAQIAAATEVTTPAMVPQPRMLSDGSNAKAVRPRKTRSRATK